MKMRKGSGEIGCLIVIVIFLCIIGSCLSVPDHIYELRKMEIENSRDRERDSLRIRVLEEEVRQLKALVPTNVTITVDLSKLIKDNK